MQVSMRRVVIDEAALRDLGLLALRLPVGALLAGHGAQKLFGAFGGYGLEGTAGWLESLGLRPGKGWALAAGLGEFGGGALTALGLATPVGLLGVAGSMGMAIAKGHWGKPIWVTEGGAELPVTNLAAVAALALAGPGRYSLDAALGLRLPRWAALGGLALTLAAVAAGAASRPAPPQPVADIARDELQAEGAPAPAPAEARDEVRAIGVLEATAGQASPLTPEGAAS
jgi:putative oxidoreductase